MAEEIIPQDVEQFLLNNIDSIAQWEGLLLLRSQPDAAWSAEMLAKHLYVSVPEAAALLAYLAARNFLSASAPPVVYRYQTNRPDLENMVERTAELYKRRLIPITNLIHSKPKTRIQAFADAFKLRKD